MYRKIKRWLSYARPLLLANITPVSTLSPLPGSATGVCPAGRNVLVAMNYLKEAYHA